MQSKLATLAALVLSAPVSASDTPYSPRVPGWKAGDAIVAVDPGALPGVTGTVEMMRLQDDDCSPELVAIGVYARQTDASGRLTYRMASVGEAFGPGDFLKFHPADGIAPSFMIWIDPAGVASIADALIKTEQ
jgi:hypothetical protein